MKYKPLVRLTTRGTEQTHSMRISTLRQALSAWYVSASSVRKIAFVLSVVASVSRKKREYDDIEPVDDDDANEDTDVGDEDNDASELFEL